jgi:GMP synthase-like glutamine amidotransferase
MKLGLLVCDPGRGFEALYRDWLQTEFTEYDLQEGQYPLDLDECDAYIATGSKASVYDDAPWIHPFVRFTQRLHAAGKPFIGICFGHQMMGHALGGRVAKSPNGWGVGVHAFEIRQSQPWMQPPARTVNLILSCQDQILDLPPDTQVLAGNSHCPAAIIRIGNMLGIQGHPEFTAAYAKELLLLRRERVGPERTGHAIESLVQPLDGPLLAQWVFQFLRRA